MHYLHNPRTLGPKPCPAGHIDDFRIQVLGQVARDIDFFVSPILSAYPWGHVGRYHEYPVLWGGPQHNQLIRIPQFNSTRIGNQVEWTWPFGEDSDPRDELPPVGFTGSTLPVRAWPRFRFTNPDTCDRPGLLVHCGDTGGTSYRGRVIWTTSPLDSPED